MDEPRRPRLRAFALGLTHAGLLSLAFPPIGWWWAVFVAPLPMFVLARNPGRSALSAGFWAMLGVAPFWAWTHAWVWDISAAGVYPLVLYLCLYTWAFVWLGHRALRVRKVPGALVLAIVWVSVEFFRSRIAWTGYPWYLTAHPLIDAPGLAAPASVGGVALVSLLAVLPAAWWVCRRESGRRTAVVVVVSMLAWIVSAAVWDPTGHPGTPVRVGVVQADVPQDNRVDWTPAQRLADWIRLRDLTVEAARLEPKPDVIVWPEGLAPGWTLDPESLDLERARGILWRIRPETPEQDRAARVYGDEIDATRVIDEMLAMQRAIGIPMLVGSVAFDRLRIERADGGGIEYHNDAMYNSAFMIERGRVSDVWYDKLHLTPFGEVMPYISLWPWLQDRLLSIGAEGMMFALSPGTRPKTLPLRAPAGEVELATPICFEATMPGVCRRLAKAAAKTGRPVLMVNITNDGWFGTSDRGRLMHEMGARWRCVELGVPMVRCANTGVSGWFDERGRMVGRLGARSEAVGAYQVRAVRVGTVFAGLGDWFGWGSLGGLVALMAVGRRNSREPRGAAEGTQ